MLTDSKLPPDGVGLGFEHDYPAHGYSAMEEAVLWANSLAQSLHRNFYQNGHVVFSYRPRITTEESVAQFPRKVDGLRVLLINPVIREWAYPNILPLGLAYIASVAVQDGHEVHVLDLNAERREPLSRSPVVSATYADWEENLVIRAIEDFKPQVIGIGGIITQYRTIKHILTLCREFAPGAFLVLGGGIASSMPEFMVRKLPVDAVVIEEGEVTFSHLLEQSQAWLTIPGVLGKCVPEGHPVHRASVKSGKDGLDYLPWPLRSLFPMEEVYKRNPVGHLNWERKWVDGGPVDVTKYSGEMIASRGCPYAARACDYCYASYLGVEYRLRSPEDVVDEMEYLQQRYGLSYIHFLDDLMLTDYRWNLAFCDALARRRKRSGFEIEWGGTCRTNIVAADIDRARRERRPHFLEQAHEVGMRQVGYGIESGSPTILKNIDKTGQTPDRIMVAVLETQRIFGYADCSFMIGSPGETPETVKETVELCKRIGLRPEVFFFTTAYPGTPFWKLALEKGLVRKAVTGEKGPADDAIIEEYFMLLGEQGEKVRTNFSDLDDKEIEELSWWAIKELGAQNTVARHPHTGDVEVRPASGATL